MKEMGDKILMCPALAMILSAVTLFAAAIIGIWTAEPGDLTWEGDLAWKMAITALVTFLMAYAATVVVIELGGEE